MQLRLPFILTVTITALLATSTLVFTAEESADKPAAKTTANPDIPADELALMLHPFTKAELLIEADGWQALVREKAVEISRAEIAVKRQTKEIAKTKEIQSQAEDAEKDLQQVKDKTEEAKASGDTAAMQDAEKAGALVRFLSDFEQAHINMSKIESRPAHDESGFAYWFFMDIYGHIDDENIQEVLQSHNEGITCLGSYAKGEL